MAELVAYAFDACGLAAVLLAIVQLNLWARRTSRAEAETARTQVDGVRDVSPRQGSTKTGGAPPSGASSPSDLPLA